MSLSLTDYIDREFSVTCISIFSEEEDDIVSALEQKLIKCLCFIQPLLALRSAL